MRNYKIRRRPQIGHIVNVFCPMCGGEMKVWEWGDTKERFLICEDWEEHYEDLDDIGELPRWSWVDLVQHGPWSLPLPEDLALRLAGQPELPLFAPMLAGVA